LFEDNQPMAELISNISFRVKKTQRKSKKSQGYVQDCTYFQQRNYWSHKPPRLTEIDWSHRERGFCFEWLPNLL